MTYEPTHTMPCGICLSSVDVVGGVYSPHVCASPMTVAVREAEARGVLYAQEELVRRDQFSSRTLEILDALAPRVLAGQFDSDLFPQT